MARKPSTKPEAAAPLYTPEFRHEIFKQAVYWHFVGHLKRLRLLDRDDVQRLAEYAGGENLNYPLHMAHSEGKTFDIPGYADGLTGAQVVALMLACLWVLIGEGRLTGSALLSDWPDLPLFVRLTGETRSVPGKRKRPTPAPRKLVRIRRRRS